MPLEQGWAPEIKIIEVPYKEGKKFFGIFGKRPEYIMRITRGEARRLFVETFFPPETIGQLIKTEPAPYPMLEASLRGLNPKQAYDLGIHLGFKLQQALMQKTMHPAQVAEILIKLRLIEELKPELRAVTAHILHSTCMFLPPEKVDEIVDAVGDVLRKHRVELIKRADTTRWGIRELRAMVGEVRRDVTHAIQHPYKVYWIPGRPPKVELWRIPRPREAVPPPSPERIAPPYIKREIYERIGGRVKGIKKALEIGKEIGLLLRQFIYDVLFPAFRGVREEAMRELRDVRTSYEIVKGWIKRSEEIGIKRRVRPGYIKPPGRAVTALAYMGRMLKWLAFLGPLKYLLRIAVVDPTVEKMVEKDIKEIEWLARHVAENMEDFLSKQDLIFTEIRSAEQREKDPQKLRELQDLHDRMLNKLEKVQALFTISQYLTSGKKLSQMVKKYQGIICMGLSPNLLDAVIWLFPIEKFFGLAQRIDEISWKEIIKWPPRLAARIAWPIIAISGPLLFADEFLYTMSEKMIGEPILTWLKKQKGLE